MSIPAFGWALEQGARLKLQPSDRLVLIYLADQANGALVCRPGQPAVERFTGLAPNTVMLALKRLEAAQLIRAEASPGRATKYHILRQLTPANGEGVSAAHHPRKSLGGAPANGVVVGPPQNVGGHPRNREAEPPHNLGSTPANGAPVPSSSQESSPKTRAPAREEASKELRFGKKEEGGAPPAPPPPAPPPKAPTIGATNGSGSGYRQPGAEPPPDDFNDFLDKPTPTKALPCEADREVRHGEVLPPDAPLGPQATSAFVHSLARNFQNNYPARAPALTRHEQIELCQPKPPIKPLYAPEAVRRAAHLALAERAAAQGAPP